MKKPCPIGWEGIVNGMREVVSIQKIQSQSMQQQELQQTRDQQQPSLPAAGISRREESGSVTIEAVLKNSVTPGVNVLNFLIDMNTHSVDLDQYDLKQLAFLRDNLKRTFKPSSWQAPAGGHHRSGTLTFQASQPIIEKGTTYLELVINDVARTKERVLRWEIPLSSSGSPGNLNGTNGVGGTGDGMQDHHGDSSSGC